MAVNAPQSTSSFGIGISMIVFASMRTLGTAACLSWACLVWARAAGGGTKKAHDEHDDSSSMRILPRPCASWIRSIFRCPLVLIDRKFSERKKNSGHEKLLFVWLTNAFSVSLASGGASSASLPASSSTQLPTRTPALYSFLWLDTPIELLWNILTSW